MFFRSINSKRKEKKFPSCKNLIETKIHQPLQIRTYKHRCFVFCPGHTSLICVPGVGKKNQILLNRIGIKDLSHLFGKYRQINDIEHFQQWLENHVGFSSYQAKMTTCALAAKLGDIHEINTGLKPICCPKKERRKDLSLSNDDDKINSKHFKSDSSFTDVSSIMTFDDIAAIKRDDLHSVPIDDRSINSMEKILLNSKSSRKKTNAQDVSFSPIDHHLTEVKSPNGEAHATLPSTRKKTNNSRNDDNEKMILHSSPTSMSHTSTEKKKTNLSSEKTRIHFENSIETVPSSNFEKKDTTEMKNNPNDLISRTEISTTLNDFSILTRRTNMDDHLNAIVPHSIDEIATNRRRKDVIDSPSTRRSSTNSLRSKIDSSSSINAGSSDRKANQTSNHQNKDRFDFESIHSTSSFLNNSPKKSILRTTQLKSTADFSPDTILSTIKERRKTLEDDQMKVTDNNQIDSTTRAKLNDPILNDETNSRSISSLKRFYASLPLSTPATFPIKRKISRNNETSSSFTSNTQKDATNRTSSRDSPSNISTTEVSSMKSKFLDLRSPRIETENQYFPTTIDDQSTRPVQKSVGFNADVMSEHVLVDKNAEVYREIDKIVNLIMEQALTIAKDQGHPSQINVTALKKNNTPNAPTSTVSLTERFAQVEAKKLATFEALNKETSRSRVSRKINDLEEEKNDRRKSNEENVSTTISSDNNVTSERFLSREKEKESNETSSIDSTKNSKNNDQFRLQDAERKKIDESNWKISPPASHDKTDMMTTFEPTGNISLRSDYKLENTLWNDSSRSQSPLRLMTDERTDSSVWNSFDPSKNPNDLKRRINDDASASSVIKSHIDQHDNDDHSQEKSTEIIKTNNSKLNLFDQASISTLKITNSTDEVPSTPKLCTALWNQISDEKILSSRMNSSKISNENC